MNIRECRQCHKMVDFDEPWCDHETMEESAWADIRERMSKDAEDEMVRFIKTELAKDKSE